MTLLRKYQLYLRHFCLDLRPSLQKQINTLVLNLLKLVVNNLKVPFNQTEISSLHFWKNRILISTNEILLFKHKKGVTVD